MLKILGNNVKVVFIFMFVFFVLVTPVAGNEQEFIDENPLTDEMVRDNSIQKGFSFNSNSFEEIKEKEDVIATSGIMPNLAAGADSYDWWITNRNITDKIAEDGALDDYLSSNGGFVGGYGPFADGTIHIRVFEEFRENLTTRSDFPEVVAVFEEYALKENVSSPPLVFLIEEDVYPMVDYEEIIPQKEINKTKYSMIFAGVFFVLIIVLFLSFVMKKKSKNEN